MSDSSPWLSVLVPCYGVERYLEACVESVVGQGVDGIEVLLLDDASPDRSGEIAAMLARRHPGRVRALAHPRNRGLSAARNSLLEAARGDYVWFVDSDDVLLPGSLARLRAILAAAPLDLVLCDFSLLRARSRWRHRLRGEGHRSAFSGASGRVCDDRRALARGLLEARQLHAWSKIARRGVWARAPFPEGRSFEDMAAIPALVAATGSWWHEPAPWVGYRQRGDSIVATMTPRKGLDVLQSLRDLQQGLGGFDDPALRAALGYFCLRALAMLARRLPRGDVPAEAACRQALADLFPDGIGPVVRQCWRRGWGLRAWRLQRSLRARGWA